MSRYTLTVAATTDIAEILAFIAERDGTSRALRVADALESAFDRLAAAPRIGRVLHGLGRRGVRWWPVRSFMVAYDGSASPVVIVRVIHGARDLNAVLRGR